MMQSIFLVIPSYNDSTRLGEFLPSLCKSLCDSGLRIQIQVVDDGSLKSEVLKTGGVVDLCRKKFPCILPLHCVENNQGKGGAVYAGWSLAQQADWLSFVDADGAITAEEVVRFCQVALSQEEYDGILASRVLMLGHEIDRTFKRHLVGRAYATLAKILVGVPVYDSQCGFKLFRRSSFEQVLPELRATRFGFDMELIAFLYAHGFRILEMPIRKWRDVPGAKVRLLKDSVDMFFSLLQLRKTLRNKSTWML